MTILLYTILYHTGHLQQRAVIRHSGARKYGGRGRPRDCPGSLDSGERGIASYPYHGMCVYIYIYTYTYTYTYTHYVRCVRVYMLTCV